MVLFALSFPINAVAAEMAGRIPTVTRLVKLFSEYEQRLDTALKAGDAASVESLLDPDFEMQPASGEADVVAREEWVATSIQQANSPARAIVNLGARDFDPVVLVSFDWIAASAMRRDQPTAYFVTDVWRRTGESWRLRLRIIAQSRGDNVVYPGRGKIPPAVRKKY